MTAPDVIVYGIDPRDVPRYGVVLGRVVTDPEAWGLMARRTRDALLYTELMHTGLTVAFVDITSKSAIPARLRAVEDLGRELSVPDEVPLVEVGGRVIAGFNPVEIERALGALIEGPKYRTFEKTRRGFLHRLLEPEEAMGPASAPSAPPGAPPPVVPVASVAPVASVPFAVDTLYVDAAGRQWLGAMAPDGRFQSTAPAFARVTTTVRLVNGHAYRTGPTTDGSIHAVADIGAVQPVPAPVPAPAWEAPAPPPWGPYRPDTTVFLGGSWYTIDHYGRATHDGLLHPQPPPPTLARHMAIVKAARKVPKPPIPKPPPRPAHPRESAPPASILPSQIGAVVGTVGGVVKTVGEVVKTVSDIASAFSGAGGVETGGFRLFRLMPDADTGIPKPNADVEAGVNVGLGVLAAAYPPWTTALAGVAKIAMAIWNAVDGALRDTFHPNALQAEEWLTLFRIDPGLLFSGVDNVVTPEKAARLVRYLKLIAGEQPMKKGWGLHNPNDSSPDNPYQNSVDPTDPLTDPRYLQHIHDVIWRTKKAVSAHHNVVDYTVMPPTVVTKETARRLLGILRHGMVQSGIRNWSEVNNPGALHSIRVEIKRVRKLAGEHGPDPVLSRIFGDVSLPKAA